MTAIQERVRLDGGAAVLNLDIQTEDGRWLPLHSRRDPVAEADRWLEPCFAKGDPAAIVIIGLGLGYVLDALERRSPATRVIALEPHQTAARACLERRDWTQWIDSGRLRLLIGPEYDGAAEAWRSLDAGGDAPPVLVHPVLAREFAAAVTAARAVASRIVFNARANADAARQHAKPYLLNTLRNLPVIGREADVSRLAGAFPGTPAVVIAAGPSLDRSVDQLRQVRERAILIAVDTALRPLVTAGIEPHFVVGVDPSPMNATHLAEAVPRDTWLVAEGSLDPAALAPFGGRSFVFRVADHHPWPWLRSIGVERGMLAAWGSVVTSALDLATRLGCDPIVFTGVDLAFTGDRPYCAGTTWDDEWTRAAVCGQPIHLLWRQAMLRWHLVQTTDLRGRPTTTAPHLLAFRDWLLQQTSAQRGRRFINASEGGILFGERIETIPLARALGASPSLSQDRIQNVIAAAHVIDPTLPNLVADGVDAVRALAAGDEPHPEPIASWHAIGGGAVSGHDVVHALAPATTLQERFLPLGAPDWDALARALDVRALVAGSSAGALPAHERIRQAYDSLVRDGSLTVAPFLSRPDLVRLCGMLEEIHPTSTLVLNPGTGQTTLLLADCVPGRIDVLADPVAPGRDVMSKAAAIAAINDSTRWRADASAVAYDVVLVNVWDEDAGLDADLSLAFDHVRPGGTVIAADLTDRVVGTRVRQAVVRLVSARPDVVVLPSRSIDWFSRLTALQHRPAARPLRSAPNAALVPAAVAHLPALIASQLRPSSVMVVARGATVWAAAFEAAGDVQARGIDPGDYEGLSRHAGTPWDVIVCIDAIEHVPAEREDGFVASLVELSDTIVFSTPPVAYAGTGYANQRPLSHWAEKLLAHGYIFDDALRATLEDRLDFTGRPYDFGLCAFRKLVTADDRAAVARSPALRSALARSVERIEDLFVQAALLRLHAAHRAPAADATAGALVLATEELRMPADRIAHESGDCFRFSFSTAAGQFYAATPGFAGSLLEEDGRPMPWSHMLLEEIQQLGRGRYCFWRGAVYFSTSDNTDPRRNGRTYSIRVPAYVKLLEETR